MAALVAAVRPFAGGVPRRAAAFPSDASERESGKKRPRVGVPPARNSSACLTKMTAAGNMSSQELLQKRLAAELDALRGLLKKAELISQRGACKGGAPAAVKKERFSASNSNQRAKPIEEGFSAPSAKKRKISAPVEQKQKQVPAPPRMSLEQRNQIVGRLSSLCGQVPEHIVEFLQKQFGDADSHGEIQINMDTVEDSVLFELKTLLDKFAEESKNKKVAVAENKKVAEDDKFAKESKNNKVAGEDDKFAEESKNKKVAERSKDDKFAEQSKNKKVAEESKDDKLAEESKGEVVKRQHEEEYADINIGLPRIIETGNKPPSSSSSGDSSDTKVVQQSVEAKKVQDAQQRAAPKAAVDMRRLLYRAKLRRQLLEMERAVLPDQRIDPRDLQRLGIAEYGHPSIMRQLGLVLKVVEA